MGDFNSKIGIKTDKCEQNTSIIGAMLEEMIKLADLQVMSSARALPGKSSPAQDTGPASRGSPMGSRIIKAAGRDRSETGMG